MTLKKYTLSQIGFWSYLTTLFLVSVLPSFGKLNEKHVRIVLDYELRLDYLIHIGAYITFFLIYVLSRFVNQPLFKENSLVKIIGITIISAIVTEAVQLIIPYRTFNPFDCLSNIVGVGLGILISISLQKFIPKG